MLARTPLRVKLPAIIFTLLLVGLGIVAVGASLALSTYLTRQADEALRSQVDRLGSPGGQQSLGGGFGPTDYAQSLWSTASNSNKLTWRLPPNLSDTDATPQLSVEAAERHASSPKLEPYTVPSMDGSMNWRVVSVPVTYTDGSTGFASIALPLSGVENTMTRMRVVIICSTIPILIVGSLAGYILVRRSLRPLTQVETTAAAIAGGDLTQRVPPAPSGTEVGRLTESLNGMLTQIERAFAAKDASEARMRQFVADASHELRTPLVSIRGYGELYRIGALTRKKDISEAMRRIEQESTRMGSLVHDLLQLARLDEGRPLKRQEVDLSRLALDAASDAHAVDPTRPIEVLGADGAPLSAEDPIVVPGDEDRLRQVLTNLVTNACTYTPAGTPIELKVSRIDGAALLQVIDHGPGIDPAQAARVFERFYRLETSRARVSGGSGLGLAIVASLVAAHGGGVDVIRTPGGGATFRVTLPA